MEQVAVDIATFGIAVAIFGVVVVFVSVIWEMLSNTDALDVIYFAAGLTLLGAFLTFAGMVIHVIGGI